MAGADTDPLTSERDLLERVVDEQFQIFLPALSSREN